MFTETVNQAPPQDDTSGKDKFNPENPSVAVFVTLACVPLGMLTGFITLLVELPLTAFEAWTVSKVWEWYNLSTTGLHITMQMAFGLLLVLHLARCAVQDMDKVIDKSSGVGGLVGTMRAVGRQDVQVDLVERGEGKRLSQIFSKSLVKNAVRTLCFAASLVTAWAGTFLF